MVALLVGGAFMAGRLLSLEPQATARSGNETVMRSGPGGSAQHVSVHEIPAPELPQTAADAQAVSVRREDSSVYVGTGQARLMVQPGAGQSGPQISSHYDGPVVEVLIGRGTTIYRDTTEPPHVDSGDVQVQQTLAPGLVDEIGQNSMLQVWGKKTGDRVVAQAVVYTQPAILSAKPGGK